MGYWVDFVFGFWGVLVGVYVYACVGGVKEYGVYKYCVAETPGGTPKRICACLAPLAHHGPRRCIAASWWASCSAMTLAAQEDSRESWQLMVQARAQVNRTDCDGRTSLLAHLHVDSSKFTFAFWSHLIPFHISSLIFCRICLQAKRCTCPRRFFAF